MALPPLIQEALVAFTRSKWQSPHCVLCHANAWAIDGTVDLVVRHPPGSFEEAMGAARPTLPCAAFTCRNCGNTVLVNLVVAGAPP